MNKLFKTVLGAACVGAFGVEEIYRYVFCRHQPALLCALLDAYDHGDDYYKTRDENERRLKAEKHEVMSIFSDRGQRLVGYYFMTGAKPSGRLAFVIHGYHSNAIVTAGMLYDYYKSRGFDLFCCENTATAPSGGEIYGYGVFESADCLKWIDYLRDRLGTDVQIVIHGFSMGGTTVASMCDRCGGKVSFGVDDCGFTSGADMLRPRLKGLYGTMDALNRFLAGYALADTDVRAHVENAAIPMLFVHGREDRLVPFAMGEELFERCSGEKDALFVDGAGHVECIHRAREAYETKLDEFIEKYMQ